MDWLEDEDNYEPTVQKIKKLHSNPNKKHRKDESRRKNKEILYEKTEWE